jgi:hypothetical protein
MTDFTGSFPITARREDRRRRLATPASPPTGFGWDKADRRDGSTQISRIGSTVRIDKAKIEGFLHGQVNAWNAHDKVTFLNLYRAMTPENLRLQYVGQPLGDGWAILENMWSTQNDKIEIEVIKTIIVGAEAACHHRNRVIGTDSAIETIEVYAFGEDDLSVRYFVAAE